MYMVCSGEFLHENRELAKRVEWYYILCTHDDILTFITMFNAFNTGTVDADDINTFSIRGEDLDENDNVLYTVSPNTKSVVIKLRPEETVPVSSSERTKPLTPFTIELAAKGFFSSIGGRSSTPPEDVLSLMIHDIVKSVSVHGYDPTQYRPWMDLGDS